MRRLHRNSYCLYFADSMGREKAFRHLVYQVARSLSSRDCEGLCFIFRVITPNHCFDNPLKVLVDMETMNLFSSNEPHIYMLAKMMDMLRRADMKSKVDDFIGK